MEACCQAGFGTGTATTPCGAIFNCACAVHPLAVPLPLAEDPLGPCAPEGMAARGLPIGGN
ncbi:hypothetical protein [Polaromonas sp. CG9_12]|nr:hypothetical protein [Polaromonas sp. CG9_12]